MSEKLRLTFRPGPVAKVPILAGTGLPKSIDQVASDLGVRLGTKSVQLTAKEHKGDPFVVVEPSRIVEALKFLRDDERYLCTLLQVISAVDYPPGGTAAAAAESSDTVAGDKQAAATVSKSAEPGRIEVVYMLWSFLHRHQITVKVYLDRDNPRVPTVVDLYRCANWYERECYDMVGVVFENHPDLKRILLPEDWVGHPLRRDYVFPEEYNGMKVPL